MRRLPVPAVALALCALAAVLPRPHRSSAGRHSCAVERGGRSITSASAAAAGSVVREERQGDSPKFDVVDAAGVEWEVKLGPEVHTEIAAASLLRAAAYFVEEMHYVDRMRVEALPRLERSGEFGVDGGTVRSARLEARHVTGVV